MVDSSWRFEHGVGMMMFLLVSWVLSLWDAERTYRDMGSIAMLSPWTVAGIEGEG